MSVRCAACDELLSEDGKTWMQQGYDITHRYHDRMPIRGVIRDVRRVALGRVTPRCATCADRLVARRRVQRHRRRREMHQ